MVDEMRKLKEEGLVDHVCISTHMKGDEISDLFSTEDFEGVTLGYSAINFPFREEGVKAAAAKNMGIVIMNPLGGGTIVNNPDAFSFIKMHENQSIVTQLCIFFYQMKPLLQHLSGSAIKNISMMRLMP